MNLAIPGPSRCCWYVSWMSGRRHRRVAVGQHRGGGRLVSHEQANLLGMPGHQCQRVHRAAAAGEQVDGTCADCGDDARDVVSVLLRRRLRGGVVLDAALDATRVVGNDRSIGEVARQRPESGRAHGRPDQHQHRRVLESLLRTSYVMTAPGASSVLGHWFSQGCGVGHGHLLIRCELGRGYGSIPRGSRRSGPLRR